MTKFTHDDEDRELTINELDTVSGGDMALNAAISAYEALLAKRVMGAVHQPVTQPTITLHPN
jgi:bacteriocin-like protein